VCWEFVGQCAPIGWILLVSVLRLAVICWMAQWDFFANVIWFVSGLGPFRLLMCQDLLVSV